MELVISELLLIENYHSRKMLRLVFIVNITIFLLSK